MQWLFSPARAVGLDLLPLRESLVGREEEEVEQEERWQGEVAAQASFTAYLVRTILR